MRFNSKELALVVQQTVHFDKEGNLLMKDKQDGFFKKSEAYINRYVRLKGNLLFYFKSKDSKSDPLGVIILERCAVELALDEEIKNGFMLVFEGEDHAFRFGASTESVRDDWIQALHIASHECLKMQLQSLREQLQTKTGSDPVHLPTEPNSSVDFESHSVNASEDPVLEISISCSNLPSDSSDTPPNPLVVIHTMLPPQQQIWMHHNHTEIVERSNSPQFLKTIGFGDKYGIDTSTRVRLTVHHVVERMTGTMTQLGQAMFTLQDILKTSDLHLTLTLKSHDMKEEGDISVTAWINDERVSLNELQAKAGTYNKRPRTMSLGRHSHNLQAHFTEIIKRSFRFDTNNEKSMIQVSEYMAESKWTFEMPIQLLRLWVTEEKRMISLLQDLGELVAEWETEQLSWIRLGADAAEYYTNTLDSLTVNPALLQNFWLAGKWKIALATMTLPTILPFDQGFVTKETSDYCMSMVVLYNQHVAHLNEYSGVTFKRSVDKDKQELEFVPVNLHIDRMVVSSDKSPAGKFYDIATCGAFTAHCRDLKNGGLRRMLHNVRASYTPDEATQQRTKIQRACTTLNEVTELRTQLKAQCEKMCQAAVAMNADAMNAAVSSMKEKVIKLNSLCAEPVVIAAAESYLSAKRNANTSEGSDTASLRNMPDDQGPQPEQSWKWSGSNFVKSPTMEPWEVTRLNMEAAFVCLVSVVEDLTRRKSQQTVDELLNSETLVDDVSWIEQVKPAVTKMQGFVEIVWARLSMFLIFLTIMENKGKVRQVSDQKTRRDIVNAHAITTLVSSFAAVTQTDEMVNPPYLEQLCSVGLLFQAEGLLSCYGSELGMLEDTIIAVEDLNHVTFRLVAAKENEDFEPKAHLGSFVWEGSHADINRHNIIIDMPVPQDIFSRLPKELQQGRQIRVIPVAFNVGINEQATLAEKLRYPNYSFKGQFLTKFQQPTNDMKAYIGAAGRFWAVFGSTALQEKLNMESFARVYEYYMQYSKYFDDPLDRAQGLGSLSHMIKMLQNNVMTKKSKNVEVLHTASEVTRALRGLRVTFCKSGKDRTAMAVTLEMVHILQRHHNLASHVFMQSLDCLRSVGCRRENTLKNVGVKKYAFISLQMLYIPKLYRAPSGTYGNVNT